MSSCQSLMIRFGNELFDSGYPFFTHLVNLQERYEPDSVLHGMVQGRDCEIFGLYNLIDD